MRADDNPHFTTRGPDWHADAFHDAPAADALLMIAGVGHGLGGIAGLDAKETEAENPDALETTRRLTTAWLRKQFGLGLSDWDEGDVALRNKAASMGTLIIKAE